MRWWLLGVLAALHGAVAARYNDWQGEEGGDAFGLLLVIAVGVSYIAIKDAFKKGRGAGWTMVALCGALLVAFLEFPIVQAAFAVLLVYVIVSSAFDRWRRNRRL